MNQDISINSDLLEKQFHNHFPKTAKKGQEHFFTTAAFDNPEPTLSASTFSALIFSHSQLRSIRRRQEMGRIGYYVVY